MADTIRDVVIKISLQMGNSDLSFDKMGSLQSTLNDINKKTAENISLTNDAAASYAKFEAAGTSAGTRAFGASVAQDAVKTPNEKEMERQYDREAAAAIRSYSKIMKERKKAAEEEQKFKQEISDNDVANAVKETERRKQQGGPKGPLKSMFEDLVPHINGAANSLGTTFLPALTAFGRAGDTAARTASKFGRVLTKLPALLNPAAIATIAVTAGVALLSTALAEGHEINSRYWEGMARDAEFSAERQHAAANRVTRESMAEINSRKDISEIRVAPGNIARQDEREARIQQEQDAIAHRSLGERQAIRTRIEGEGGREDKKILIAEKIKHLEEQKAAIEEQMALAEKGKTGLDAADEAAKKARRESKEQQSASPAGVGLAAASRVGVGIGTLGISEMLGVNPLQGATDWMASRMGATTQRMADKHNLEQDKEGMTSGAKTAAEEAAAGQEMIRMTEQRNDIENQITLKKVEQLGLTREQIKAARTEAEQGADDLRETERKFGAASPGTQARLRHIQAKADAGQVMTHEEGGLAVQFDIGASRQFHAQTERVAQDPANANLFKEKRGLQAERVERKNKANAAPVLKEKDELADQIKDGAARAETAKDELKAAFEKFAKLTSTVESFVRGVDALITKIDDLKIRQNSWW